MFSTTHTGSGVAHGETPFERAVENSLALISAASRAEVKRLVHVSISNASASSPLPYFRGKGLVENAIKDSGLSHAILRPTFVFGSGDVLLNHIAWALRRFPVFPIAGSGRYEVQPVFVGDLARLAVEAGRRDTNEVLDAAGPERFAFENLVSLIRDRVGARAGLLHLPSWMVRAMTGVIGLLVKDVVLTADEIAGLSAGYLVTTGTPIGVTRLADWLGENARSLGERYASELARHYR